MRVFIDLGYTFRGVADVTAAELDTFTKVLDRVRLASNWYSDPEVTLDEVEQYSYTVKVLPAHIKLVTHAQREAAKAAERQAAGEQ
jgi:hypothetical protein